MQKKIKITITGPESSGKTTLTSQLAHHFGQCYAPEFARFYVGSLGGVYGENDLVSIAYGQTAWNDFFFQKTSSMGFNDTDASAVAVWAAVEFGRIAPAISAIIRENHSDLYLLCYPDLPWEYDPLRKNPHNRVQIFEVLHTKLLEMRVPF